MRVIFSFKNLTIADHVKGLTPSWNYGKIYTSRISKALICDKFPHLKDYVVNYYKTEFSFSD